MRTILLLLVSLSLLFGEIPNFSSYNPVNQASNKQISYEDMINYLKNSNDANNFMALGIIYANGIPEKDSEGKTLSPDPILAQKYLLDSYHMGNVRALTILGGLLALNKNMRKLDPNFKLSEKYLKEAIKKGDLEAYSLLSNTYFLQNKFQKGLNTLITAANLGDANAQFMLAVLLKTGLKYKNKYVIKKDAKAAEYFLNKACNNPHKSNRIKNLCFNSKYVIIGQKK